MRYWSSSSHSRVTFQYFCTRGHTFLRLRIQEILNSVLVSFLDKIFKPESVKRINLNLACSHLESAKTYRFRGRFLISNWIQYDQYFLLLRHNRLWNISICHSLCTVLPHQLVDSKKNIHFVMACCMKTQKQCVRKSLTHIFRLNTKHHRRMQRQRM